MYAQVLVFLTIQTREPLVLDYSVPATLTSRIRPRLLVSVPVRGRLLPGIVLDLMDSPSVPTPLAIHDVLDPEPVFSETLLELARWMAQETLTPLHRCIQTMLPPGLRPRTYRQLLPLVAAVPDELPVEAARLLDLLIRRGPLRHTQVATALKGVDWRTAARVLQRRGFIRVERGLHLPRIQPKTVRLARLVAPRATWDERLQGLRRLDLYRDVLGLLEAEGEPLDVGVVVAECGAQHTHLQMLERRGLIAFSQAEVIRDPIEDMLFTPDTPPVLIPEQRSAWTVLERLLAQPGLKSPALLLGVTGSGKTELYLRAAEYVLARGGQALILVPEISLTPQTVKRFLVRFPTQVGLWHSGMTNGERYDTWRRVRSGELTILVGARSALFAPFRKLRLIVLDEEEDSSYKQASVPRYHARETAEELCRMNKGLLILGSATPTLESYTRALQGRYRLIAMPRRVLGHRQRIADWQKLLHLKSHRYRELDEGAQVTTIEMPPVQIVDMRAELKSGNRSIFSVALQRAVDAALSRGEQALLFLNRRGTATYVFCRDCGWSATCKRCEIPLTYHAGEAALICHRCGARQRMPQRCPECSSGRVRAFGLGTEGLESRIAEQWPTARLLRWDRDVARSHAAHVAIMGRLVRGEADILIGTQMIARGLDVPLVTVVGIISADVALNLPDFRAAERTFQLLTQVAGRAGRGLLGGSAVLQTYHPEHYAVQYAARHDYMGFARRELNFRRQAGYPPATRLAKLVYAHTDTARAERVAQQMARHLRARLSEAGLPPTDLIGPAPAFFAKVRGRYRWQMLLRSVAPAEFLREVDFPPGWTVDIDPVDVL